MPQSRQTNKRPGTAGDTALANAESAAPKPKLPRVERSPSDFSSVVKSKLQSYTRTGQACDRCKVRKIRCDALPEGCSHCTNQNIECYVTDRVTGRTERRGYLQQLEREKGAMLVHIRELEKLLESNGIEVRPWQWPGYTTTYPSAVTYDAISNPVQNPASKDEWTQVGLVWVKNYRQKPQITLGDYIPFSALESRRTDSYLGVAEDNALLSSIKGTKLSILGTVIDIASFESPDTDEPPPETPIGWPLYNKSVMAFLQSILRVNPPPEHIELPPKPDAFTYAEWYFLAVSPFLPVLHKPSFFRLLTRIYDEGYKPTIPELVTVHMVFATMWFQYGIRNREEPERYAQLNELSNRHYHWCLSKFFDLAISPTLTAVQALAMIMVHTRNFPKPACSSTIAQYAFIKALELNLHRRVKMPNNTTTLENEMRKRVWWVILAVMVTLSGRLGRPMPISLHEFDVDFPIPIEDEYLGEEGILDHSQVGRCSWHVGLMGFKVVPLYMEMYTKIYGVRCDPRRYVQVVQDLDAAMDKFIESLPTELRLETYRDPNRQNDPGMLFAMYTRAFCLEFKLCLRHPSVCMSNDPKVIAENSRICEETVKELLKVVKEVQRKKSLDTTWYQLAVYLAALFSLLVAHWQRRFDVTEAEVAALREDARAWLSIIAEIGRQMGAGSRLAADVGGIIDRTVGSIEQDMRKPGPPSDSSTGTMKSESPAPYPQPVARQNDPPANSVPSTATAPIPRHHVQRDAIATNGSSYYDSNISSPQYASVAYSSQAASGTPSHPNPSNQGGSIDSTQYLYAAASAATTTAAPTTTAAVSESAVQATNPLIAFASQATQHVAGQAANNWSAQTQFMAQTAAITNAWHDWAAAMTDNRATSMPGNQDRFSATTLLTLGTGRPADVGACTMVEHVNQPPDPQTGQWPLLLFHNGGGSVSGS